MDQLKDWLGFLHDPQKLTSLILWGSYPVLFAIVFSETGLLLGFFLPGDSLLVTAGILAGMGKLDPAVLCVLLSAAAIAGDNTGYWIGRRTGPHIFTRPKSLLFNPGNVARAHRFYEKYGAKTVVLCRFVPIIRTFNPVVAGVARMAYGTYLIFSIAGGVLWICGMTLVGYFLGSIPGVSRYLHLIIVAVIVLSFIPAVVEVLRERKRSRAQAEEGREPSEG